ncbi:hypothetical protein B0H12DRAFT_1236789 [Mycena haematopus]|nr:hypothetical protein B0H12DRAFT_1236789 [Mycena haematopus]
MAALYSSSVVETFLETFCYGAYLVLFTAVIYLFPTRNGRGSSQKRPALWVLFGLVLQFLIITAHWINTMNETYYTVVRLGGGSAAAIYYFNLSEVPSIIHITLFVLCSLITDLLVVHRTYVICSHKRSGIVFPLAILLAEAEEAHVLQSILVIFVESAALQTTATICILATFQVENVGQIVLVGTAPAIFGVSTVLIHARIGLGWGHDSGSNRQSKMSNPTKSIQVTPGDIADSSRDAESLTIGRYSSDIIQTA